MSEYMTNFTGDDMKVSHAQTPQEAKAAKEAAAEQQTEETAAPEEPQAEEDEVPEGTTAEILAWVGDDTARAQAALDKEQAEDKPRVGLTGELEKVLDENAG